MIGFEFRERMSGHWYSLDAPLVERAIEFRIAARATRLRKFLLDKTVSIHGTLRVEGICDEKPLEGTLGLKLLDEQRLPYDFTFTGDDGRSYRFRGQKDFMLIAAADSMTTLPASLYDASGDEIGRCVLRFDLRGDIVKFVRSFRLKLSSPFASLPPPKPVNAQ